MQFARYSTPFAAGTAGFLAGIFCHNFHYKRFLHVSSAREVKFDVNGLIFKEIETTVTKLAPIMKHGLPSYDTLRTNEHFMLSYDRKNRVPLWVMEHLTSNMTVDPDEMDTNRAKCKFFEDQSIHPYFRSTVEDYRNSGYDRGHLAAAANYNYSKEALDNTFVLSNVAPQNISFNRGIWRTLEKRVRDLAIAYGSVYVCSGPLYLPRETSPEDKEIIGLLQGETESKRNRKKVKNYKEENPKVKKFILYEVIGPNNTAVPTHFFKIILCEVDNEVYDMEAYIIPNQPVTKKPLEDYMVPKDAIERHAGFLLFQNLPSDHLRRINGKENISVDSSLEDT